MFVNLSGSWESWVQKKEDKREIVRFGETFCLRHCEKKSLFHLDRQLITERKENSLKSQIDMIV